MFLKCGNIRKSDKKSNPLLKHKHPSIKSILPPFPCQNKSLFARLAAWGQPLWPVFCFPLHLEMMTSEAKKRKCQCICYGLINACPWTRVDFCSSCVLWAGTDSPWRTLVSVQKKCHLPMSLLTSHSGMCRGQCFITLEMDVFICL